MSVITKDLGIASAYGYAKSKGYTGTEEEFAELMASYASVAEQAAESAQAAETAKDGAITAKNAAETARDAAVNAKTDAQTAQTSAETASATATTKAGEASSSAQNAASAASSASASATTASGHASTAQTAAGTATTKAQEASASATAANTAKTDAETAQAAAETAQVAAETAADGIEAAAAQIEKNTQDITKKADAIHDTASGSIASFPDGADDAPMKSLVAQIEPVQDLHGYDAPWPAGGGKNKVEIMPFETKTMNGITFTKNEDGSITINGTSTGRAFQYMRTYSSGWFPIGKTYTFKMSGVPSTANRTFLNMPYSDDGSVYSGSYGTLTYDEIRTYTSAHEYNSILLDIPEGQTFNNNKIYIYAEEGTTVGEWTPYSNISPITGWTGASVTRTGKNLVNIPTCTIAQAGHVYPLSPLPQALHAGTYTVGITSSADAAWSVTFRDSSNNVVGTFASNQAVTGRQTKTETLSATATQVSIYVNAGTTLSDIMVEFGSTASAYEAFTDSDTVSVDWTAEAGTVYGGTLDVTTGLLTVDRKYEALSSFSWSGLDEKNRRYYLSSDIKSHTDLSTKSSFICDTYNTVPNNTLYNDTSTIGIAQNYNYVYVRTPDNQEPSSGYLCYEVAQPQTVQLTAEEVTTLLGQNNIFADTGDSTVQYRADTKLYIDKVLNA